MRKLRNRRPLYPSENRIFRRINICWSLIISKPIKYYVYNYIWPRQAEDGQTNTNGSQCPNTRKLFCVTPATSAAWPGKILFIFIFPRSILHGARTSWILQILHIGPNRNISNTRPRHRTQDSRAVNEPSQSFTVAGKDPYYTIGSFPCGKILTKGRP